MILGKLVYAIRFSNSSDINMYKLVPYLVLYFIYMMGLMLMIYDNLGDLFVPSIVFLFASLIFVLFGFLREGVVNKVSFF